MDIWSTFPPKPIYQSATPKSLHQIYNRQKLNPSYQNFIQQTNATIFGTIDDHDYGMNNGDKNYIYKKESGVAFLDFIDINKNSIMYQRAKKGLGVYGVIVLDFSRDNGDYLMTDEEAGLDIDLMNQNDIEDGTSQHNEHGQKRVAIFVLDVRTNKTPWGRGKEAWSPNYDGDFLGEKQWSWFEKTIRNSNASVNIIVSGLQVHPYRVPNTNGIELWSHFPTSRQRLYDAILQDNVQAPILVSGDVHMAQFLRKDCMRTNDKSRRMRPLVEMTTSGMTHSWGTCFGCSSRLHTTWKYYPCHLFSRSLMTFAHFIFPMPDLMNSYNNKNVGLYEHGGAESAKQGKQYALQLNFGEFEFDWEAKVATMRVIGKESGMPPMLSASFSFDQLSGREPIPGKNQFDVTLSQYNGKRVLDGNVAIGEFICINHQSNPHPIQLNIGFTCVGVFIFVFMFGPHLFVMSVLRRMFMRRNRKCK